MNNDLISRRVLKSLISDKSIPIKFEEEKRGEWKYSTGVLLDDIYKAIDNAPTIKPNWKFYFDHGYKQAERDLKKPQGEWVEGKNGTIKCNKCGCEIRYSYLVGNKPDYPKFCCDCGAKMKDGEE